MIIFPSALEPTRSEVTDKRRFSGEYADDTETLHTPAGMTDPAAPVGRSADGADLASTDMSQEPSSREPDTEPVFRGGAAGVPMEPQGEAVRRLEQQLEDAQDRHLRLAAEYDNYRKRVLRERGELGGRAQATLVTRLLDVLDDLDRLTAEGGSSSAETLHQAVELIDRKFRKELQTAGLERIDPVGAPFDPNLHEAVSTTPPPRPELDHTVSATFQVGYLFKGGLVRPARVQVYSEQGAA
jgi:molecular chaperone GrpE